MAKKRKNRNKNKQKTGVVNRLFDVNLKELSIVDKPAIGEEIILIKRTEGSLDVTKKVTLNKATQTWKELVTKAINDENESCVFCGITKEQEAERVGLGLLCGVCFDCAVERYEKGVFDDCINGTFDIGKYKLAYPEDPAFKIDEKSEEIEDEEKEENEESEEKEEGEDKEENKEDEEDNEENKEDEDVSDKEETDESEKSESEDDINDENDNDGFVKSNVDERLKNLEETVCSMGEMLENSLNLHEQTANSFTELLTLTFASLDLNLKQIEETDKEGEISENNKKAMEIKENIKSVKEDISKAGAKISGSRLQTLRDIAEKLTQLIESVMPQMDEKKESKNKSLAMIDVITDEIKKSVKDSNDEVKKVLENKISKVTKKLEDLEFASGLSSAIEDEEINEDEEKEETKKADFSDILGLDDIRKKVRKRMNF